MIQDCRIEKYIFAYFHCLYLGFADVMTVIYGGEGFHTSLLTTAVGLADVIFN